MRIRLHPQAKFDLECAADWYEENADRDVAADFLDAYDQAAELIREHPEVGRFQSRRTRSIALRRFPFSLVYTADEAEVLIVAVAHWRRRPMFWTRRKS